MSAPKKKKLSGAENRKRAKERTEQGKQIAANMKKWLQGVGEPSNLVATPDDAEILDYSSTISKQHMSADSRKRPPLSTSDEQLKPTPTSSSSMEYVNPEYKESLHLSRQNEEKTFDLSDPGTWPETQKMTDQQRSLLSSQAVLLAEKHPGNINFKSTERDGRHLTSCMWYKTLANNEMVKRSWLLYSKTKNALFCTPCKIFLKPNTAAIAISTLCSSTGFSNWKKASERLIEHEASQMHRECMIKWKIRVQQMKMCQGIDQDLERIIHTEKEKWKQILHIVIDAVLFLSANCLSFRGSNETPSDLITQCPRPSQGNFLNLISLLAKHNSVLKHHLEHLKKGQVSYLSKTIQNEIIEIMANSVRNKILNDIKEAKYYTIMFDCTPDVSHTEQMSQVIRYVKQCGDVCEIKESFIDFLEVGGKTGEYISQRIMEKLTLDGLDIGHCRGQSYDNGSNMASTYKGVQARITEVNRLAEFVPCLAHSLNLVGVHSASSCPEAVSLFGIVQKVFVFFVSSTTRWDIMKKCTKTNLKGSSQTRWSAKHVAVKALLNNLPEVVKSLEEIKETLNAESKYEAGQLLHAVKNFEFIINLTIWANILREINRVNIEIQKEDIILARSISLMDGLTKTLQKMRENSIEFWVEEAKIVAAKIGVDPVLKNKRIPKCKKQYDELCDDESRTLQSAQLLSKSIKMVFDRVISEITTRFESATTLNLNFAFLNGYEILNMSTEELIKNGTDLARKYDQDLNESEFCQELTVFKVQAPLVFGDIKQANAFCLLKLIYTHDLQDAFPNICIALRIYATIPTTSASCERSFSKMKQIKNYLRSSMSQERLSSLAILAIENETAYKINYDEAIDLFAEQKARKVKF